MHRIALVLATTLAITAPAQAAGPAPATVVTAGDMHIDRLQAGTATYLVYMHGGPGSAISRTVLATSTVARERVDGVDAWVIEQDWVGDTGQVHSARTVHAASDLATLAQTSTWIRPNAGFTTTIAPGNGTGTIEGDVPPERRAAMEAGFATMDDGWWLNWHSDLALLPLLPYERGGTLRVRLFDVGMPAPMDVDYTVVAERTLRSGDGDTSYDCWVVETDSGSPGTGNFQRFWIDKARRIVVKEEDVFNGQYRSKVLLGVPAVVEYAAGPAQP